MARLNRFADQRALLFSVTATVAFVILLFAVVVLGALLPRPYGLEAEGTIGRLALAGLVLFILSDLGWLRPNGLAVQTGTYPWLIVVLPFVYGATVYPLLFTGKLSLNLRDPVLSALVAANGFAAGLMEELVFRGLILYALLRHWGSHRSGLVKSLVTSSLLFSVPHALNVFAGSEPIRVAAQLVWAVLLGIVFGMLVLAGGNIWPVAALHGVLNALVHVNGLGEGVKPTALSAVLLAIAPVPLLAYGVLLLRKGIRLQASLPVAPG
jgi:membrane protease YdiL (CAAX protease family)